MNEDEQEDLEEALDEEPGNSTLRFEVSISTDRDHFLRRTCPSCGQDFKTLIDQADLSWLLSDQIKRIGPEIGLVQTEDEGETELQCPYCHYMAKSSEIHTEETINYLKRFLYREYVIPMLNRSFSDLEDSIGRGHSGGGFVSISLSFKHEPITLPPRPIHGPEPADMKIIQFLCCNKQMKVHDSWNHLTACSYCRSPVTVV